LVGGAGGAFPTAALSIAAGACSAAHASAASPDASGRPLTFCELPGSVVWTAQGPTVVPGIAPGAASGAGGASEGGAGASAFDLTWLSLPPGFCSHYFGKVGHARQLRFAPGGELFVASPSTPTVGGNPAGAAGGIVVLPDDDRDGVADTNTVFLDQVPSIQGLLFANGLLYYQDGATLRGVAYRPGDRRPSAASAAIAVLDLPQDAVHWPKAFDIAEDGTLYVTNGGSQFDACLSTNPVRGAVVAVQPGGTTRVVARGFRNPIALRCETARNVCLVAELGPDDSVATGGREKLVPVRDGDDWGFPCCATRGLPYAGAMYADQGRVPDCAGVAAESDSFAIGRTPFGIAFEEGHWPAPWQGSVFVTLHGEADPLRGARVVAIPLDANGIPVAATDLDGGAGARGALMQFADGWDNGPHGRPAAIAFARDGRLFVGDDNDGIVVWIAPLGL
jgi:glucose/arabinose dehydrogenase